MEVTTVAGSLSERGFRDGKESLLNCPSSLAKDSSGNIYIADTDNFRIRKLSPNGIVSTIAGTGKEGHRDGKVEDAQFGSCFGIAVGRDGSIYVSDYSNHVIRRINNGMVSTLAGKPEQAGYADGKGEDARFDRTRGLCVDSDGSLLVADNKNRRVRRVTMDGVVSTFAGSGFKGDEDGDLHEAKFRDLYDICMNGDEIYVSDYLSDCVKKISNGRVVSLRGITGPIGVTFLNGTLFTVSFWGHRIYKGENFELLAGSGERGHKDGALLEASFVTLVEYWQHMGTSMWLTEGTTAFEGSLSLWNGALQLTSKHPNRQEMQ